MDENSLAQNDEGPISVAQVTAFQDPHTNLIIPTQTPVSYQIFPQGDQISIIWHTMTGKTL